MGFWPYYVLSHHVRHPKTKYLDLVHVYVLGKWTIDTQGNPYPMIWGDLVLYSCSSYSAFHRVMGNALKAPTDFPEPYEQF